MSEITREQKCRRIVEACGGHWHDDTYLVGNPTFTNVADLLRLITKRSDWQDFCDIIGTSALGTPHMFDSIDIPYILEPDKLLNEFYEWLEEGKK